MLPMSTSPKLCVISNPTVASDPGRLSLGVNRGDVMNSELPAPSSTLSPFRTHPKWPISAERSKNACGPKRGIRPRCPDSACPSHPRSPAEKPCREGRAKNVSSRVFRSALRRKMPAQPCPGNADQTLDRGVIEPRELLRSRRIVAQKFSQDNAVKGRSVRLRQDPGQVEGRACVPPAPSHVHVFDVRGDVPLVAKRIFHGSVAVAVRLIDRLLE